MSSTRPWRAQRVLHPVPLNSVGDYCSSAGGLGLRAASTMSPAEIIEVVLASGLRGRGGAGFPVGRKWATVADNAVALGEAPSVVVNMAEGEPGTFKDRAIVRNNPYQVIEGALIAAKAVGAVRIIIATKAEFATEVARLRAAIDEVEGLGKVPDAVTISLFEGPSEYLYGEESALLEAIDGRGTFPRVTPTYRVGLDGGEQFSRLGVGPALVNNLETIANVPKILARGAAWFRRVGTTESPGTVVCTVTGDTRHHGVAEVRFGTSLGRVLRAIGGGAQRGRSVKAVLSGVANPVITGAQLSVPVSYEGMRSIGSGVGSAGFIVFDDLTDMVAVAAGVARFLSVESCGQCSPCKHDGMRLATLLASVAANTASERELLEIDRKLGTVADGARCYLATQQEVLLRSILVAFGDEFDRHVTRALPPVGPTMIAELIDFEGGSTAGRAVLDERHRSKQPDWTFGERYSGHVPIEIRSTRHGSSVP
ncbi:MAG: NADH-ubiquinone oxidoreductase-F iron-sulfur binding region domain-containing protein [Actinomycetota bacterium]